MTRDNGWMVAGIPTEDVLVPNCVRTVAAGRPVRLVWQNALGGLTFEIGGNADRCFVKWAPHASGIDLGAESARLVWASVWSSVPRVLGYGSDDLGSWLVTAGLPGDSAVSERWIAQPDRAVRAIGRGLRVLHDSLPVERCPFSWSLEDRLADVRRRAATGLLNPARWHPMHQTLTLQAALAIVGEAPPVDKLVVCHGDACAPNTLLTHDGNWSGHVDLGALGVADRWADLAVATWSTEWNYGPGWTGHLLDAYGIDPDPRRMAYYRLLWDLGP